MATAPLVPLDHVERRSWLRRFIGMVCRRYRTRSTPISIQDKARFPRSPFVGNWLPRITALGSSVNRERQRCSNRSSIGVIWSCLGGIMPQEADPEGERQ